MVAPFHNVVLKLCPEADVMEIRHMCLYTLRTDTHYVMSRMAYVCTPSSVTILAQVYGPAVDTRTNLNAYQCHCEFRASLFYTMAHAISAAVVMLGFVMLQ